MKIKICIMRIYNRCYRGIDVVVREWARGWRQGGGYRWVRCWIRSICRWEALVSYGAQVWFCSSWNYTPCSSWSSSSSWLPALPCPQLLLLSSSATYSILFLTFRIQGKQSLLGCYCFSIAVPPLQGKGSWWDPLWVEETKMLWLPMRQCLSPCLDGNRRIEC